MLLPPEVFEFRSGSHLGGIFAKALAQKSMRLTAVLRQAWPIEKLMMMCNDLPSLGAGGCRNNAARVARRASGGLCVFSLACVPFAWRWPDPSLMRRRR